MVFYIVAAAFKDSDENDNRRRASDALNVGGRSIG